MTAIINNFRVQERKCHIHGQFSRYILIETNPTTRMKLICNRCYSEFNIQNNSKIISIQNFKEYLGAIVTQAQNRVNQQLQLIDIHKLIAQKKQQIEQKQYRLLELMMKKLTQDKQDIFLQLDLIEKIYLDKQNKFKNNLQQRNQIIKYLKQFCIDDQLFKLKLMVSNQYGLNSFMAQIKSLELLGEEHIHRNPVTIADEIRKQMCNKQGTSFLLKLQQLFKKSTQQLASPPLHILKPKPKSSYNNQITQRRNQSQQIIPITSPRTSRQQSFAQLPKLVVS